LNVFLTKPLQQSPRKPKIAQLIEKKNVLSFLEPEGSSSYLQKLACSPYPEPD
jgi:hypothetical protein